MQSVDCCIMGAVLISRILVSITGRRLRSSTFQFTVIIGWQHMPPLHCLKTFVDHRVDEIMDNDNPLCGITYPVKRTQKMVLLLHDLVGHHLWRNGPSFLNEPRDTWSLTSSSSLTAPEKLPEIESYVILTFHKHEYYLL